MKPNFALSLSSEGIKLLHRAAGGWREVGEASIAADDLSAELAMLRKTAASLEPGGVRSKLIIPASQIKYLTIDTMGLSEAACRKSAEAALRNATPYDVSDLAYDISLDGAKTHVAAVARETLEEAEAFANEHRFHPVSFVAVPDEAPYLGEPFFGVTTGVASLLEPNETVEPDGIAVVVVGSIAPTSQLPPPPTPQPAPASTVQETMELPEPKAEPVAPPAPKVEPVAPPAPKVEPAAPPAPKVEPAAPPAPKVEPAAPPAPKVEPAAPPAPKVEPAAPPAPRVEPSAPLAPKVGTVAPPAPSPISAFADKPADKGALPPPRMMPSPGRTPITPALKAAIESVGMTAHAPLTETPVEAKQAVAPAASPLAVPHAPHVPVNPTGSTSAKPPAQQAPTLTLGFASRRTAPAEPKAKPLGGAQRIAVTTPKPDSSSLTHPAPMADPPAEAPTKASFLSRRKKSKVTSTTKPVAAAPEQIKSAKNEAERMTVFGARPDQVRGKPRFLGLILTVVLLVFLAGVAAWAAVFLDDGIAGLIRNNDTRTTASDPQNQIDPEIIRSPDGLESGSPPTDETVQIAALDPVLSAEDAAILDALQDTRSEPERPVITAQEAAARYAVSGIWPLAPDTPLTRPEAPIENVYFSTIDPVSAATDAIALPAPVGFDTDVVLASVVSPPPFGQRTTVNAAGLIEPTATGVVTPGGFTLIAASPPLKPPAAFNRTGAAAAITPAVTVVSPLLGFRPKNRPNGLAERTERAQLGGVSRIELAAFRPSLRPRSLQDRARQAEEAAQAEADRREAATTAAATAAAAAALAVPQPTVAPVATSPTQSATRLATPQSRRPDTRPRNFARIVKRAERSAPAETRVAAAATVAPRTVAPSIPSKTSVARSATLKNAINLRQVNLIGVYGKPSSRRALIRLSNGRYQKVKVGDRIDGGRVSAIGNSDLRYTKNGRNVVLKMP